MAPATWKRTAMTALFLVPLAAPAAFAQSGQAAADESPWSVEVGIGWDDGVSGNLNSSGIGQLDNQAVVVTANSYEV